MTESFKILIEVDKDGSNYKASGNMKYDIRNDYLNQYEK